MHKQITSLFVKPNRRGFLTAAIAFAAIGFSQPAAAQSNIISAEDAYAKAKSGEIILVDIRTPREWLQTGLAEGAIALDLTSDTFVDSLVHLRQTYPDKVIAMICRTGNRTGYVFNQLTMQGFPGLADVSEGMTGGPGGKGWIRRGLPIYAGTKENVEKRLSAVMNK